MQGLAWGVGLIHAFGILVLQAYIRVHTDLVRQPAQRSSLSVTGSHIS